MVAAGSKFVNEALGRYLNDIAITHASRLTATNRCKASGRNRYVPVGPKRSVLTSEARNPAPTAKLATDSTKSVGPQT